MKLNIYKNQKEIEKTYETETYDLMYGTVEDVLGIFDDSELTDDMQLFKTIQKNRQKINDLLYDIFPGLTAEEVRRVKVKELIPIFIELFTYVTTWFGGNEKN